MIINSHPTQIHSVPPQLNKNGKPGRTNRCVWVSCLHPKMLLTYYCYSSRILIDRKLRIKNQLSLQLSTENTRVVRKIVEFESNIFLSTSTFPNSTKNDQRSPAAVVLWRSPRQFFLGLYKVCVCVCFKVRMMFLKNGILLWTSPKILYILIKMIQIHMKQTSIFVMFFGCSLVFASWVPGPGKLRSFSHFYILDHLDSWI